MAGQGRPSAALQMRETTRFDAAASDIEAAIQRACEAEAVWPAKVVAGINAAVDFVVDNPAAARTLAIDSRGGDQGDGGRYPAMIRRFASLLGSDAPRSKRLPGSSDEAIVWVIAGIVGCHIRAGTEEILADGDPDLVFLALLPYVGFAEASRWSQTFPAAA